MSFLLQFQLPLLSLHKLKQLPSGPDTLSPTPPYEVPLPLGGNRAPVWPVAKLPKLADRPRCSVRSQAHLRMLLRSGLREPVPAVRELR